MDRVALSASMASAEDLRAALADSERRLAAAEKARETKSRAMEALERDTAGASAALRAELTAAVASRDSLARQVHELSATLQDKVSEIEQERTRLTERHAHLDRLVADVSCR